MITATLKINSFQNSVTVLKDGGIIFNANKTHNFKVNSPILQRADAILDALRDELNARFSVSLYGNAFERAFMKLKCANYPLCVGFEAHNPTISLTTQERLMLLALGFAVPKQTVAITIDSEDIDVSLPSYLLIDVVPADDAHRIVVSENRETLLNELLYTDECAFLLNGESEEVNGRYIIGCTPENVQELVQSYVETKYINPLLGKLFGEVGKDCPLDAKQQLVSRIEPFFYASPEDTELAARDDEFVTLPIHSLSLNSAGEVVKDAAETFRGLEYGFAYSHGDTPFLEQSQGNMLCLIPQGHGSCAVSVYFESNDPITVFHLTIHKAVYATHVVAHIQYSDMLEVGRQYPLQIVVTPEDAIDRDSVTVECSDTDIAEIQGDHILIKQPGKFTLTAKTQRTSGSSQFFVHSGKAENIYIPNWPDEALVEGCGFSSPVKISPPYAARSGFSYKVLKGKRKFDIGKDNSSIFVRTKKKGTAKVRFFANSNPEVYCDKTLKIKRGYCEPRARILGVLAIVSLVIAGVLLLFRNIYFWPFAGAAFLLFVSACLRREERSIVSVFVGSAIIALMVLLRLYVLFPVAVINTAEEIPEAQLLSLQATATATVRDNQYNVSDSVHVENYRPHSVTYLGYYFLDKWSHNMLYYVFEVDGTNQATLQTKRFYVLVSYEKLEWHREKEFYYTEGELKAYTTFEQLVEKALTMKSSYEIESYVPDEIYYGSLGMTHYITADDEIGTAYTNEILKHYTKVILSMQSTSSDKSLTYSNVKLGEVEWKFGESIYSYTRNTLIVNLYREQYKNGEYIQTLTYAVKFTNVYMDKTGKVIIDMDEGVLSAK